MALQQPIAFEYAESLIGYELDVLIDRARRGAEGFVGRTFADAPEIDACVRVEVADPSPENCRLESSLPVEITGREGYDLVGTVQ